MPDGGQVSRMWWCGTAFYGWYMHQLTFDIRFSFLIFYSLFAHDSTTTLNDYIFPFLIGRYGPHFDTGGTKTQNVTAQVGSEAYLDCRIRLLQDKTVTKSTFINFCCISLFILFSSACRLRSRGHLGFMGETGNKR